MTVWSVLASKGTWNGVKKLVSVKLQYVESYYGLRDQIELVIY